MSALYLDAELKRGPPVRGPPIDSFGVPSGTPQFFLLENGHPPQSDLDFSIAPRLDFLAAGIIFLPELGQQLDFWLQDGASSVAPRLGLALSSPPHLPQQEVVLAALLHCDLQALAPDDAHAGASSAALRPGLLLEPELAHPAMARTRLIPRVLSMNFIEFLQGSNGPRQQAGQVLDRLNIAVERVLGDVLSSDRAFMRFEGAFLGLPPATAT